MCLPLQLLIGSYIISMLRNLTAKLRKIKTLIEDNLIQKKNDSGEEVRLLLKRAIIPLILEQSD